MKASRSKPVTNFALALLAAYLARHLTFTLAGANLFGRDLTQLGKRSTDVETVEASKLRNEKFYQGANFLKMLVQLGDLKDGLKGLNVGSTQFKLSPTGQYFGFGRIGEKVLIISGEEPDIMAVVLKLFPPNNKGLVSMRLLLPKGLKSLLFADKGKHLGDLRQTLTKLHLDEKLPIDEVLVEVVGEPFKAYDAVKWFLNLANGEQLKQEARQFFSVVHKDMNRNLSNNAEILIPVSAKQSGIIIGKGGASLERLRSKLKVFVDVQGLSEAKDGKVIVTLKGPIGSVHEAHLAIQRLLAVTEKSSPQDTSERGA